MKKLLGIPLIALSMLFTSAAAITTENTEVEVADTEIIVKFEGTTKNKTRDEVIRTQNSVLNQIYSNITPNVTVESRMTNVLSGAVMKVPASKVNAIRNLAGVHSIDYNKIHCVSYKDGAVEKTFYKATEEGASSTGFEKVSAKTMNVPDDTKKGEGVLIGILDSGFLVNHEEGGKVYTHEALTDLPASVNVKVTQESLRPIITSASFHGKPDETHSTYFSRKVPFYYDYGGLTHNSNVMGEPKYDVYSPVEYHGMHVATIAAGKSDTFEGIAPNAQLALLKVFTDYVPEGDLAIGQSASCGAYDSAVLQGLEDAAAIGCDVVNMSFGSNLDDFDANSILSQTIAQLEENGMYMNVSAGNSGKGEYYLTGAYANWTTDMVETGILSGSANNEGCMTIAAGQGQKEFYETALFVDGNNISYSDQIVSNSSTTYTPEHPLSELTLGGQTEFDWVKVGGWGEEKDYEGLDVEGKFAIVDRGETTFLAKINQAKEHGAIAVGVINNDPTDTSFTFRMDLSGSNPGIPVFIILNRDKATFDNAESSHKLTIISNKEAVNPTADELTSFTSDGGTYDLRLKPEITAPGQSVIGAIYHDGDGNISENAYTYLSGTSMSSPNYTGAVAVMLSEHLGDKDYFDSLNARAMSTTSFYKDSVGNVASVRFQGAGLVNVGKALSAESYLHGVDSQKAKIELKNGEDIAKGEINLSFNVVNEQDHDITYKATTYVYRPALGYTKIDEDNPDIWDNVPMLSTRIEEIAKAEQTIVAKAGEDTHITLDKITLSDAVKKALDDDFENGCSLEGYVVLEAQDCVSLSIPWLGYYGDLSKVSPVEPFSFEKTPGKLYASDALNDLCEAVGYENADYGSDWIVGYWDKEVWGDDYTGTSPLSGWLTNETPLSQIPTGNGRSVATIGNKQTNDGYVLYTANNDQQNTMILQQYVMRSVATNSITVTNKATQEVILNDHMFDSFFGSEGNYMLYKSHVDDTYLSAGYISHRAYTIIPLWDNESAAKTNYPDGEYEFKMQYTLPSGTEFTYTYTLVISSEVPTFTKVTTDVEAKKTVIRLAGTNLKEITVNDGTPIAVQQDSKGYYAEVDASGFDTTKLFITVYDWSNNICKFTTYVNDPDEFTVSFDKLVKTYKFTTKKTVSGDETTVAFTIQSGSKTKTIDGGFDVTFNLFDGYEEDGLKIYNLDKKKNRTEANFTIVDRVVSVHVDSYGTIVIVNTPKATSSSEQPSSSVVPSSSEVSSSAVPSESSSAVTPSSSEQPTSSSEQGGTSGCSLSITTASFIPVAIGLVALAITKKSKKEN